MNEPTEMTADAERLPDQWLKKAGSLAADIAWVCGDHQLSFDGLAKRAYGLAERLYTLGVRPGDLLAIQLSDNTRLYPLLCAAASLGVALFPLDPSLSNQRRNRLLAQGDCQWILSDQTSDALKQRKIDANILELDADQDLGPVREMPLSPESVLLVIATSGTTGNPRGVMLSAGNLAASVVASKRRLRLGPGDTWLNCLPLFHIGGLAIFYRCLEAGARVVQLPGFQVQQVWDTLCKERITHLSLVPAMLSRLLDIAETRSPPPHLKRVLIGGGALSAELAARAHSAGWPICVTYGMSETASQFATDCSPRAGLNAGVVGTPLEGYEVSLSEENKGVVRVRGEAVMAGYLNRDLEAGEGLKDGWFETGDYAEFNSEGALIIQGRMDDVLISGGKTIHPTEVETQLLLAPGVESVAVSATSDPVWGDLLIAVFVGNISPGALELWAREHLSSALRPREFLQVDELPTNFMGKLDRKRLREMLG